ncbi:MAG: hypothetical protein IPM53_03625 [Anaerolineaceae bacterium]|nr:hypothetical protein [Anaerolineaceae bacterium]
MLLKRNEQYRILGWFGLILAVMGFCTLLATMKQTAVAQTDCSTIYNDELGWTIEICPADPIVSTSMIVLVDGIEQGEAAFVRFSYPSQNSSGKPQVAVFYASGYIRLKQGADPTPAIPFGTSVVLGPAYWPDQTTYYHNPLLTEIDIDTSWLPIGPLRLEGLGNNHAFDISYNFTLPSPKDRQTRLHVTQTYTATTAVSIDPARRAESQGFKLVQFSSMYINEGGGCDFGNIDCHDSNSMRFIGNDLERHQVDFSTVTPDTFIINTPVPLGSSWLDALHTDDTGWQGNTPNLRIAQDTLPSDHTITAQGWISATTNPEENNVSLWLHDDGNASLNWTVGQSDQVSYWLLAEDNPPDPWRELALRSGETFLDFESSHDCVFVNDPGQSTNGSVQLVKGYQDAALQLAYDIGSSNGNWAQIRCDFDPPLDLSSTDHLRFDWLGDPDAANSIEVGLVNPGDGKENIFARGYHHPSQHGWWGQLIVPYQFLHPWTDGTTFDSSQVSAFFISVVKDPVDDVGGVGHFSIDNLNAYQVASRTVPASFEMFSKHITASTMAANWLIAQQQATGLLKSWEEEATCTAHTYDQALALLVFMHEGLWTEADALVEALAMTQNTDGSWYKSRNCLTLAPVHTQKWEGDIAWAIYALNRYLALGGTQNGAANSRNLAADWLITRINPADGCLVIDHTEGTIDVWWALSTAGPNYLDESAGLKHCLLTYYWDEAMGRFQGGRDWWQPYLDNQTWGAAFLKSIGEADKARRALSYADAVLMLPAQGGHLFGLDGQGGPWSVWNEGMGQYVASGGAGANELLGELLAQQRVDGAVPGSPDVFEGGGVWTTRWHGVAPTAWLYFALNNEPFHGNPAIYLPIILTNN